MRKSLGCDATMSQEVSPFLKTVSQGRNMLQNERYVGTCLSISD